MKIPILVKQTDRNPAGDMGVRSLPFAKGDTEKDLPSGLCCVGLLPTVLDLE